MQHTKRWLAAVLAMTMTLSDCGGMTVLAIENNDTAISSVSENNSVLDETSSDSASPTDGGAKTDDADNDISDTQSEAADSTETDSLQDENIVSGANLELPALHIGQIKKGEDFPTPDDDEFRYDLPVSFDTSEQIVLFANYHLNAVLEEENGTLVWSILRSEKEMLPGSTSLLDEEDDWAGFETVYSSPFFVMEEITDEESEYFQMIELTPAELSSIVDNIESYETGDSSDSYDYYIRAAYYPESENEKTEDFYAAATIPFLPQKNTAETQDDTTDGENAQTDILPDDMTDEATIASEETQDDALTDAETADTESGDEETDMEQTSEESVSENSVTSEPLSTLSENEDEGDVPPTNESFGVLTLDAENVTLHIGKTSQIRATLEPKNIDAEITWTSSDPTIVSVSTDTSDVEKANGSSYIANIEALQVGTAQITAKCGDDLTATVKVNVIAADENEVYDLSGDIWVSGFKKEDKSLVYTGQKVTQDFQVYYKETLLKEKTDYTLTYKNNVNAATSNDVKAPNVTITMKGQYQGSATLYYTIKPASIQGLAIYNASQDNADETGDEEETSSDSSGYKQTINYSTNLKFPTPELLFGKKKLAVNKDFVCDYTPLSEQELYGDGDYKKGASYSLWKTYYYNVNGKGNFTGTIRIPFVVVDKKQNFSSATVKLNAKQYAYPLTNSEVKIEKLTLNKQIVDPAYYSYDIYATGIDGAYIMVYPTPAGEEEGYRGFKKVALKLVGDRKISDAVLGTAWKESIPFSQKTVNEAGGIFQNENGELLTFVEGNTKEALTEGQDYTVKYTNAKKVGTVTATFTGKGRYKGTLKKKYTITPNTDKKNFTIRWKNVTREGNALVIAYQKGGAVPDFILLDQDNNVLKNKTDYTVRLKDNKAPGNMSCEITGKGNYKGYTETVQITVKNGDLSQCTLSVPDKPYSTRKNAWKSKVTVKDVNGKTLAAGKDYEKEVSYNYPGYTGTENEQPPEGTTVTVTVKGMDFYANEDAAKSSLTGQYRIFDNNKNISKLIVTIDPQEYTGKEIILSDKDIHVYATAADKRAKNELKDATSCYQIVEYKNNIKAGTAKVTLHGIGAYGGTKTYSFKIQKKAYLTNRVAKITLDKKKLNISITEKGQKELTATITPKDPSQKLTNPTIIWTTSNSNIATVKAKDPAPDDNADTGTNTDNSISVTAEITVQNAGTVKITAIAQDGNKKAVCTVTISVPALKEKNQTIRRKTGDTYQLSFVQAGDSEMNLEAFTFESTNLKVASVDTTGLVTMKRFGMVTIKVSVGSSVQQCSFIVERVSDDELDESNGVLTYEQKSGCKDDTAAINALLKRAEDSKGTYDTVYIPDGTYNIDAVNNGFGGIILRDNQNLIMANGAKLMAIANSSTNSQVIWAFGRKNVTITGGQIIGERNGHKGTSGEWGHGINISGCTNVYISNVKVSNCWGDGIYLGFYDGPNVCSNGVIIENCTLNNNRRNNLSITDVSNVTIRNCQFNNASGTDPQYGIDIEPNAGRPCKNIKIYDSTFSGNAKASLGIMTPASDIRLEGCTLDGQLINWSGTNVVLKNTTVKGGVTGQNAGNVKYE